MLVLSRKIGEKIMVGKDIVITLVDIDYHRVKIGIEAPREVQIFRQEVLEGFPKHRSSAASQPSTNDGEGSNK